MIIQIFMFGIKRQANAKTGSTRLEKKSWESAESENLSGKSMMKISSARFTRCLQMSLSWKFHRIYLRLKVAFFLSLLKIQLLSNVTRLKKRKRKRCCRGWIKVLTKEEVSEIWNIFNWFRYKATRKNSLRIYLILFRNFIVLRYEWKIEKYRKKIYMKLSHFRFSGAENEFVIWKYSIDVTNELENEK